MVVALGIALLAVVLYIPSFWVPFYLDDYSSIVGHERLLSEEYALYLQANPRRLLPYLTVVFDYAIWGENPVGYHIINTLFHAINAFLVFCVIRALTLQVEHSSKAVVFAGMVALVWAIHPLMSQPVVYIIQRITLIAATFYLLTLYSWISYRSTGKKRFIALTIVAGLFALLSKEIAFTLPLTILLIDFLFFKKSLGWLIKALFAFAAVAAGAIIVGVLQFGANFWLSLDELTRDHEAISRMSYFWAQQEVVFQYLYKFVWPYPLLLEYPYYEGKSFSDVWPYFLTHLGLLAASVCAIKRQPLITFGIVFFYLSLIIESSFIPIRDFGVEHRSYLGGVGMITALVAFVGLLLRNLAPRYAFVIVTVVIVALSSVTIARVLQWQQPVNFYERELQHSEEHPRVQHTLGLMLVHEERYEEAERYFRSAFLDAFERDAMTLTVAKSFLDIAIYLENYEVAQRFTQEIMQTFSNRPDWQAEILASYAQISVTMDRCEESMQIYRHALSLSPDNLTVKRLMGECEKRIDLKRSSEIDQ